jgi:glycosyltransferase involved in cell wall biosynthesis
VKISVLVPAFNEEENIEKTLKGLEKFKADFCAKKNIEAEIIVIDDGSRDKTYAKAAKYGVEALRLEGNRGKGGALREGLKRAEGEIIVFLDADLRESSYEVYKLVEPILNREADVAIARFRPPAKKGGFGLVKTLAFYGIKIFTGKKIKSALSGQRAFARAVLEDIGHIPDGYSLEVGMLIDILKKGYNVKEVDVDMYHDVTGRDLKGFIHRGRQFFDILKVLISKIGERKAIA